MLSRRELKQQRKEAFLQENPTLIENETQIEVVQDDTGRYRLGVTENDDEIELIDLPKTDGWVPHGLVIPELATAQWFGFDGPVSSGFLSALVLSEGGIGVASIRDAKKLPKEGLEALESLGTLGHKEVIKVEVEEVPFEPAPDADEREFDFLDHGGKAVSVDFDIIGGSGQVQLVLIDENTGREVVHNFDTEISTGRGRRRDVEEVDHVEAVMGENLTFEEVEIRTTGDLEIAVTGIDLSTGYVDNFLLPA